MKIVLWASYIVDICSSMDYCVCVSPQIFEKKEGVVTLLLCFVDKFLTKLEFLTRSGGGL